MYKCLKSCAFLGLHVPFALIVILNKCRAGKSSRGGPPVLCRRPRTDAIGPDWQRGASTTLPPPRRPTRSVATCSSQRLIARIDWLRVCVCACVYNSDLLLIRRSRYHSRRRDWSVFSRFVCYSFKTIKKIIEEFDFIKRMTNYHRLLARHTAS